MKTLRYIVLLLCGILVQCCITAQYRNKNIYADIYKAQQLKYGNTMFVKTLNYYRQQIPWIKNVEGTNPRDTIYALELSGIQGEELFTYWNKQDTISYTYQDGAFSPTKNNLFTAYMMRLVSEWNISKIREEEEVNGNMLPSDSVYALRITFNTDNRHIECIRFKNFFNLKRDSY
jgi:hypothetical protein